MIKWKNTNKLECIPAVYYWNLFTVSKDGTKQIAKHIMFIIYW